MRKFALPVFGVVCLGVLLAVSISVQAEEYRPCCEGGFKPNKPCVTDANCPDICVGGFRDGKPCGDAGCPSACVGGQKDGGECFSDADCPAACAGGFKDGSICSSDADCTSACVGGSKDGKQCTSDANCPGGTCSDYGNCSDYGLCADDGWCEVSTCTALCKKGKPQISPDDPVLGIPEFDLFGETEVLARGEICP
jgi:hypothetical protein